MLKRQKTLIVMLKLAGRPVTRFELTKWSFLLRHEFPSAGGSAFYDFVPYQYGPFSFSLYQELDKLEAMNYIRQNEESIFIGDTDLVHGISLDNSLVTEDIQLLLKRFGNFRKTELTDHVYLKYPQFTCNSHLRRLSERPVAKPAVFTAGYEGCSIDSFLNLLIRSGIQRLIDVRRNPIARRYGFHRSTLNRLCDRLEIEYVHVPSLGIPSDKRRNLHNADDYRLLFSEYKRETLRVEIGTLQEVGLLMKERPSVLVCMEKDPNFCHRSAVAAEISKQCGLPICNLGCENGR